MKTVARPSVETTDHNDGQVVSKRNRRLDTARRDLTVITYDIRDNDRRERVARWLSGFGDRVQKSVFECELVPARFERAWDGATRLLGPGDRLHAYVLCAACRPRVRRVPPADDVGRGGVVFA